MASNAAPEYEEAPKLQVVSTPVADTLVPPTLQPHMISRQFCALQVPGGTETSCTFVVNKEDHTLGNALRYVLMRNPSTAFCGYSMPHPSESLVNIRLQTTGARAVDVFRDGLQQLVDISEHVLNTFDAALVRSGRSVADSFDTGAGAAAAAAATAPSGGAGGADAAEEQADAAMSDAAFSTTASAVPADAGKSSKKSKKR